MEKTVDEVMKEFDSVMKLFEVMKEFDSVMKLFEETEQRLNDLISDSKAGVSKNEIINLAVNDFIDNVKIEKSDKKM